MHPSRAVLWATCFSVVACGSSMQDPVGSAARRGPEHSVTKHAIASGDDLVVQEWGTYTSVQASDGHALGGVHHVDERLPYWVHRRNFSDPSSYFFERLTEEPLQQLETPVLYFWSPTAKAVQVKVDFPQGLVGEWYPSATKLSPPLYTATKLSGGSMTWDVTVDPAILPSTFLSVDPAEIWAPSRRVDSTPVRFSPTTGAPEEREQFIFYRGLATFDPPVRVLATDDGKLHVRNDSSDDLESVFVLRVTADGAQVVPLDTVAAGATLDVPIPEASEPIDAYVTAAQRFLQESLVGSGLETDVAQAMVDTWTRSWFKNVGLRVLYLAPRTWTDGWLPTTITPTPTSLVRTLVGRIEVITPAEEVSLVATVRKLARSGERLDLATLGRFAEPRLMRTLELLTDPTDVAYGKSLVALAHVRP